jgi:hypothetical protein
VALAAAAVDAAERLWLAVYTEVVVVVVVVVVVEARVRCRCRRASLSLPGLMLPLHRWCALRAAHAPVLACAARDRPA